MNREIKFRAWDKDSKCYWYSTDEAYVLKWIDGILGLYEDEYFYREGYETNYILISQNLEQYTGLKDKNNREIYEGDILKAGKEFYSVYYSKPSFNLKDKNDEYYDNGDYYQGYDVYMHNWEKFEIVGNIHENNDFAKK